MPDGLAKRLLEERKVLMIPSASNQHHFLQVQNLQLWLQQVVQC